MIRSKTKCKFFRLMVCIDDLMHIVGIYWYWFCQWANINDLECEDEKEALKECTKYSEINDTGIDI